MLIAVVRSPPSYTPTNNQASEQLCHRLEGVLDRAYDGTHVAEREIYYGSAMNIAAVGHQSGTCRFAIIPAVQFWM